MQGVRSIHLDVYLMIWLLAVVILASCVPGELEPSLSGPASGSQQEATATTMFSGLPTPFPSPTSPPSPQASPSVTPTAWDPQLGPPPMTSDQGLPPVVTPTPVPPPPGLVYNLEGQLWQVGEEWQPAPMVAEPGDVLSADGQRALRIVEGNVWLISLPGGQRFNLTGNSGRFHCCPHFWPGRPDTIVFGSWAVDDEPGPSTGYLSSAKVDLSEYRVLDEEHLSNAEPAPGPDGRTIAYDRAGAAWLYDWNAGPQELDPQTYGLSDVVRIGGPAWSPDGRQLAWTVAVAQDGWRIAVAVFDLDAGTAKLLHPYENIGRGGWFGPPAWSPDGRWLAFTSEDADATMRGVWVIDVESGAEIYAGAGVGPIWSPDGRWLLVNPMDPNESSPWLVQTETWYPLQMHLPPGALAVDWLP